MTGSVLVVGGGIIGHTCAVALAENGFQVCLFDNATSVPSASAATTGLLIPPTRAHTNMLTRWCVQSAIDYPQWCAALERATDLSIGYQQTDALRLLPVGDLRCRTGERPPSYLRGDLIGAIARSPAAHVHTASVLNALVVRFAQLGGYTMSTPIVTIERGATGTVRGVRLPSGAHVHAQAVLVAAGVASGALLAALDIGISVTAEYGQIVQFDDIERLPDTILLDGDYALVQKDDGRVHISGVTDPHQLLQRVQHLFGSGRIASIWHGYRPRMSGGFPLVGRMPGWTNLLVAIGHGKNGYLLAPSTADVIVRALVHSLKSARQHAHTSRIHQQSPTSKTLISAR